MKISVITSPFGELPPFSTGAVEKLFYQLAKKWIELGHSVHFICAGGGESNGIGYTRLCLSTRTGATLTDLPIDFWYSIKAVFLMPKCDVLVCNTFWSPIVAPLFFWKYRKLIYGVHRYPKKQMVLYQFVHLFICVSTAVGEAVKNQTPSVASKVKVICNPIDTSIFVPKKEFRFKLKKEIDDICIVYSGRIAVEKGILNLAKAIRKLSNDVDDFQSREFRLILIGPWEQACGGGGESYLKRVKDVYDKVDVVGPVYDPKKMADLIRGADIYCYPTIAEKGEAFGIAPLEAMGCGVPVVLPKFKCFSDYAKDGVNCVQYESPDEIVDKLRVILKNGSFADRISEGAQKTVKNFSIDKIARQYLECFTMLIKL